MFGISCGSYCFASLPERKAFYTNSTITTNKLNNGPSYEEIELKCHNSLETSYSDLLFHAGRYYRRLPESLASSRHKRFNQNQSSPGLKLRLPDFPETTQPKFITCQHTNEQLNRPLSIIDVTDDNILEPENPVAGEPIVEAGLNSLDRLTEKLEGIPMPTPSLNLVPALTKSESSTSNEVDLINKEFKDNLVELNSDKGTLTKEETQNQMMKQEDFSKTVMVSPNFKSSSRGGYKAGKSLVRRFHQIISPIRRTQLLSERRFTIMISYVHSEAQSYAISLKKELKRLRLSVYLDLHEIEKGSDWQDSLNKAVISCEAFVPLVTPSYGSTLWTGREIKLADVLSKHIIPVNFGQSWPPNALAIQFATIQYISWLAPDETNPNARPLMRNITIQQSRRGKLPEWDKDCVRNVARQIKHAVEKRRARNGTEQLNSDCCCLPQNLALNTSNPHDSGFSDSSPILMPASNDYISIDGSHQIIDHYTNYGSLESRTGCLMRADKKYWLKNSLESGDEDEDDDEEDEEGEEEEEEEEEEEKNEDEVYRNSFNQSGLDDTKPKFTCDFLENNQSAHGQLKQVALITEPPMPTQSSKLMKKKKRNVSKFLHQLQKRIGM